MATMNVSLPDTMKEWVEAQVESGRYGNASDYVRDLIRRDQREQEQHKALQVAITKGLKSGVSEKTIKEILKKARAQAQSTRHAL